MFYPNFTDWWDCKVIPGIDFNKRHVVVVENESNELVGALVLKDDDEKKISTLYIHPDYRNLYIGPFLIQHAMCVLETEMPIISIPEPLLVQFENMLAKYCFVKTKEVPDLYVEGVTEVFFNDCK